MKNLTEKQIEEVLLEEGREIDYDRKEYLAEMQFEEERIEQLESERAEIQHYERLADEDSDRQLKEKE